MAGRAAGPDDRRNVLGEGEPRLRVRERRTRGHHEKKKPQSPQRSQSNDFLCGLCESPRFCLRRHAGLAYQRLARKKGGTAQPAPAPPAVAHPVAAGRAWFALAVFGVALLVRLVHVWQLRRSPFFSLLMGDSRGYDEWAQRIAGGEWLGHEVFYQAPLYPYLLGVIYAVAGRHLLLVRIVQAADRIGVVRAARAGRGAAVLAPRRHRRRPDAGALCAGDLFRRPVAEVGARRLLRLPGAVADLTIRRNRRDRRDTRERKENISQRSQRVSAVSSARGSA